MRRRSDVVGASNHATIIRVLGALVAEQHDECGLPRRYMSIQSLEKASRATEPALEADDTTQATGLAS